MTQNISPIVTTILFGLLLLAIVIIIGLLQRGRAEQAGGPWPYYAKKALTVPEQILYFRLVKALPEHIVLAQVQLSRIRCHFVLRSM